MQKKLEVIAFTADSCKLAAQAGCHRIELCDNPGEGGTTPSYGMILSARKIFSKELYVMIRPRGGDFLYTEEEIFIMKADIEVCKQLGCDGIVLGMLTKDGRVDKKQLSSLVSLAYPMGVTFHRAFDRAIDPIQAIEDIIDSGCERILTSGQFPQAIEGIQHIASYVKHANERIIIMPGSGIRETNIQMIATQTGSTEFHSSARILTDSKMDYVNEKMQESLQYSSLDVSAIRSMVQILAELP